MGATEGEYQGKPMLVLTKAPDDKYPFQFGVSKAKLALANWQAIVDFVERHKNDPRPERGSGSPRTATGTREASGQREAPNEQNRQADYGQERGGGES